MRMFDRERGREGSITSQFQSTVSAYVTMGAMPSCLETLTKGIAIEAGITIGSVAFEGSRGGSEWTKNCVRKESVWCALWTFRVSSESLPQLRTRIFREKPESGIAGND